MANEQENLEKLTKYLASVSRGIDDANKAARGTQGIFQELAATITAKPMFEQIVNSVAKHTEFGKRLSATWADAKRNMADVTAELTNLKAAANAPGPAAPPEVHAHIAHLENVSAIQKATKDTAGSINALTETLVSEFKILVQLGETFNQDLIEANSQLEYRHKLFEDTLKTAAGLGLSGERVTRSAAALVHYGMDNNATWKDNLRIVSELESGIGLSVGHAARLAAIAENQLKVSFKSIAEEVAKLVEYTSLSADEAARLTESVQSMLAVLRPGLQGQVSEITRVLGEYDSAMKRSGGRSGELEKILKHMSTIQGMPAAGLVGIWSPEFASSAEGVKGAIKSISDTVNRMTFGMSDASRRGQLELLASTLGTTVDELVRIGELERTVATERTKAMTVQQRFQNQMTASGRAWDQIVESLRANLQVVMLPLLTALNYVMGAVATQLRDLSKAFQENEALIWTVRGALAALALALSIQVLPALFGILKVVAGIGGFALRLLGMGGLLTGGLGAAALGPLLIIAGILTVIGLWLREYMKMKKAETETAAAIEWQKKAANKMDQMRINELVLGLMEGNDQRVRNALYGTNPMDPGMVKKLMDEEHISWEEASEKIIKRFFRPVAEVYVGTQVSQQSALDEGPSPEIKEFMDHMGELLKELRQTRVYSDSIQKDANTLRTERHRHDVLHENQLPPGTTNSPPMFSPRYP